MKGKLCHFFYQKLQTLALNRETKEIISILCINYSQFVNVIVLKNNDHIGLHRFSVEEHVLNSGVGQAFTCPCC